MAEAKKSAGDKKLGSREEARPIEKADDGVTSRLHDGYEDNPDKPSESSIAQVQKLKDES